MTIFAHKAVDALLRKPGALPILCPEAEKDFTLLAKAITDAEKFEFQSLPVELKREDGEGGVWKLPQVTPDEREAWARGLLPLPAPLCWYEFTLGGTRSAVLVTAANGTEWVIKRFDLTHDAVSWAMVTATIDAAKCTAAKGWAINTVIENTSGDDRFFERLKKSNPTMIEGFAGDAWLTIFLTLMLHSRTTEVQREAAPPKLNRKRQARGNCPLFAHRVVRIVPARFIAQSRSEGHSDRRPPRLHWRRSHKRHYPNKVPSAAWAETEQWNGTVGWWVAIIPRFLVGAAENGTVSHEYRIEGEQHVG